VSTKRGNRRGIGRVTLRDFNDLCGGAAEALVVTPPDILPIAAAAATGDAMAAAIMRALNHWLSQSAAAPRGGGPLCFSCDAEFAGAATPAAFTLAVPFANPVTALVSGICADCAAKARQGDGLMASAMRGWRKVWPGFQTVEGGRA
jgi:hypothetical protein